MTEGRRRRRGRRQPSRLRQFLARYRFEVVWAIVVLVGIFLIFERMDIRHGIFRWLNATARLFEHSVIGFGDKTVRWLANLTLSDAIGLILVSGALVAIVLRIRWRLLRNPALSTPVCPRCQGPIQRIHRTRLDRIISLYVPVRRYRCADRECRWQGRRIQSKYPAARPPADRAASKTT